MKLEILSKYLSILGVKTTQLINYSGPKQNRIVISCPYAPWFHEKKVDTQPSMGIWALEDGSVIYHCWACHEGGTLPELFREVGTLSGNVQVLALVPELLEKTTPSAATKFMLLRDELLEWGMEKKKTHTVLPEQLVQRMPLVRYNLTADAYLATRNVDPKIAELYELRFDDLRGRVVFPVRNVLGELVGAVGRTIHKGVEPRYYNYFNFFSGNHLGGLLQTTLFNHSRIIVVEGYFDMLRIAEWCWENDAVPVCSWKSELHENQVKVLASLDKNVQLWYDGDTAGQKGAQVSKLKGESYGLHFKLAKLPFGTDPDELTKNEFQEIFKTTKAQL